RSVMVYAQTEVVKDLIALQLSEGGPLLFGAEGPGAGPGTRHGARHGPVGDEAGAVFSSVRRCTGRLCVP
ncbi:4-hydroxybenzoate 3-monooxygenase, partial [Streptomyces clavifer]